jgi:hypothetical protein
MARDHDREADFGCVSASAVAGRRKREEGTTPSSSLETLALFSAEPSASEHPFADATADRDRQPAYLA